MARYIDADGLIEKLQETICSKCNMYDGIKCKSCSIDDTLDFLENAPTADVVPKSEYDTVVSAIDNSTKEFLKLHDAYQNAKAEVERLEGELIVERTRRENAVNAYHDTKSEVDRWRRNLEAVLEERAETKSEVAREIFEEIEKHECHNLFGQAKMYMFFDAEFAELKKKYTEGET